MKINNRRYIGCKTKLLSYILESVLIYPHDENTVFADIFAGTGVVGYEFAINGYRTIMNDTLYSNVISYNAFLGQGELREDIIEKYLEKFNSLDSNKLPNNYFSDIYGDKYFSINDAKKIGYIRDEIESLKKILTKKEYFYLLTSLIYATDKIANTVGHFESFLKKTPEDKGVILKKLDLLQNLPSSKIFNEDANDLVKHIECDIAYIDPPYNARQYVNFYHVLENLARWNKPIEFEGNSMKFKRNELKSDYCRKKAPELFKDLIDNLKAKIIIVSYNNTYTAGSISSINTIQEEDIISILSEKGTVHKKEIDYNAFNAGKTNLRNHKEYLFICEVNKHE